MVEKSVGPVASGVDADFRLLWKNVWMDMKWRVIWWNMQIVSYGRIHELRTLHWRGSRTAPDSGCHPRTRGRPGRAWPPGCRRRTRSTSRIAHDRWRIHFVPDTWTRLKHFPDLIINGSSITKKKSRILLTCVTVLSVGRDDGDKRQGKDAPPHRGAMAKIVDVLIAAIGDDAVVWIVFWILDCLSLCPSTLA